MAEEIKTVQKKKAAEQNAAVSPAVTKEPAKTNKEPAKKVSEKNKRTNSSRSSRSAKVSEKKKTASRRTPKKKEPSLDDITAPLWAKFKDADISNIEGVIAIQISVENMGPLYICVRDGEKHINKAEYNDRNGEITCTYEEALKISKGDYSFMGAIESGNIKYYGDVEKALLIMNYFK